MTYTIGDRRISLEAGTLAPETLQLILSHPKLFKYCLNNACYRFLLDLKKIIHLYGDVITIYSTLLSKIPKYDDVTRFTSSTRVRITQLEAMFNSILGEFQPESDRAGSTTTTTTTTVTRTPPGAQPAASGAGSSAALEGRPSGHDASSATHHHHHHHPSSSATATGAAPAGSWAADGTTHRAGSATGAADAASDPAAAAAAAGTTTTTTTTTTRFVVPRRRGHRSTAAAPAPHRENWDDKSYEKETRKLCLLAVQAAQDVFEQIVSCLQCIEVFFSTFDNLKKLLVPYMLVQAEEIHASLGKLSDWFSVSTIVDDIEKIRSCFVAPSTAAAAAAPGYGHALGLGFGYDHGAPGGALDPIILQQLKKIERITSGIERESVVFSAAFRTFDHSLQSYTAILLGRAILKRDVSPSQCQLIQRREVCFQATEHVVNIPLHQDQLQNLSTSSFAKYITLAAVVTVLLVTLVMYRLLKLVAWP